LRQPLWHAGTEGERLSFRLTSTKNKKPINQAFWRWVITCWKLKSAVRDSARPYQNAHARATKTPATSGDLA